MYRKGEGSGVPVTGRVFQLTTLVTNPGGFPTSESDFTCTGTYEVNNDNSFVETTTCSGSVLTGSATGQTFTQSADTFHGQIRGKTLLLNSTTALHPTVVTLSVSGNLFRLCRTNGTAVKLPKK